MREGDDPAALEPARPARVRQAVADGLLGRHLQGQRRRPTCPAALAAAFEHDPLVVVEAMSHGMEVECSVLGNLEPEASVPGEIVLNADWYDYEAKYQSGGMELVAPARLPEPVRERVRALAVDAFRRVRLRRPGPVRLLRRGPRGRRPRPGERAEHHARLHRHQRVRQALGGHGAGLRPAAGPAAGAGAWSATARERGYRF